MNTYSKWKEFALSGKHYFPIRVDPFLQTGIVAQKSKQVVRKAVSLVNMTTIYQVCPASALCDQS